MTADTSSGAGAPTPRYRPDWLKKPTGEDLAWAYPERASRLGLEGKATLNCLVATDGRLTDCRVLGESPAGEGFGSAALALAPQFQMTKAPAGAGGPSQVTIPLVFAMPRSQEAPEAVPATPGPLIVLVGQGRDWIADHAKSPPGPWAAGVGLAVMLIVAGVAISRWSGRADGKDLSGPNSERRSRGSGPGPD